VKLEENMAPILCPVCTAGEGANDAGRKCNIHPAEVVLMVFAVVTESLLHEIGIQRNNTRPGTSYNWLLSPSCCIAESQSDFFSKRTRFTQLYTDVNDQFS